MNKIDDFLNTPNSQFIDKDLDNFLRLDLIESATTNIQKNSMTFDEVMNNSDPYPSLINQEDAKTLFERNKVFSFNSFSIFKIYIAPFSL